MTDYTPRCNLLPAEKLLDMYISCKQTAEKSAYITEVNYRIRPDFTQLSKLPKSWRNRACANGVYTRLSFLGIRLKNVQIAAKQKFDVSHPPQFPTIPLTNVVIDNLHLFLRVANVLINLLRWLRRQDGHQIFII